MSLTYSTYITSLASLLVVDPANSDYLAMVPNAIEYTEDRIDRDLNLVGNTVTTTTGVVTPLTSSFVLTTPSEGQIIVLESLAVITPAGSSASAGTYNPLTRVSRDFLFSAWPSAASAGQPQYYAMANNASVFLGPWPDAAYGVQQSITTRRAQLSASLTSNYLTLLYSDMYLAASMVFMAGYQKNYGAQADDPKMAMSWETQYQTLLGPARAEADRMRSMGSAWSAMTQSPEAQPARN